MISDVLHDAAHEINGYLQDPQYREVYSGDLRIEVRLVVDRMLELQRKLDTPPDVQDDRTEQDERDLNGPAS